MTINPDPIIHQLLAMRSIIDGLLLQLTEQQAEPGCAHPPGEREDLGGGFGGTEQQWRCRACNYIYSPGEDA